MTPKSNKLSKLFAPTHSSTGIKMRKVKIANASAPYLPNNLENGPPKDDNILRNNTTIPTISKLMNRLMMEKKIPPRFVRAGATTA